MAGTWNYIVCEISILVSCWAVELEQGQRRWLHANKLRPYHARVNALIGNCVIVYESDEEFGSLPVINSDQDDMNLQSKNIDLAKLEH